MRTNRDSLIQRILYFILGLLVFWAFFAPTEVRSTTVTDTYTDEITKRKLFAINKSFDYGVDPQMFMKVIKCESHWKDVHGDGGRAWSVLQFHKGTFESFKILAGRPELNYEDPYHQMELGAWAFANNLESHWTCYYKI